MSQELFPIPASDIFDEPLICIQLNKDWANILSGSLGIMEDINNWLWDNQADVTKIKASFEVLQAIFAGEDALCMPCITFRNNPENPSCIQASCDGGVVWSDAFCGVSALQGMLQQYDANGHLMVSSDGGATYSNADISDPRFNSPTPAGHVGTDAACRAAENVRDNAIAFKEQIGTALSVGGAIVTILSAVAAFIGDIFGFTVPPALVVSLAAAITGLAVSEWNSIMNDDVFQHFKCILFCELGNNVPATPTVFTSHNYDEILRHVRADYDLIPRVFFEAFVYLSGPVGLQIASVLGNNDGATCGDCDCSCVTQTYFDPMTDELGSLSREASATYPFGEWCNGDVAPDNCGDGPAGGGWVSSGGRGGGGCIAGEALDVTYDPDIRGINQATVVVDLASEQIVSGVGAWYHVSDQTANYSSTALVARFYDASKVLIQDLVLDSSAGSTEYRHFENTSLNITGCRYVAFTAHFNPVNPTANIIFIDDIVVEYRPC